MRATVVPVTPSVVKWALEESGYPVDEVAAAAGVAPATIRAWEAGDEKPALSQLRAFASKLKRPLATFLLPRPPRVLIPALEFRRAPGEARKQLSPDERTMVRLAARLQRVLSWINRELHNAPVDLPRTGIKASTQTAAEETRTRLGAGGAELQVWSTASAAFRWWRSVVEANGVFVLVLPMGNDGCRGFSLWDDHAPLITLNSAWSAEARIFTLLHEYGHLLTRTNSACLESAHRRVRPQSDDVERWCEQFAAAVLLPSAQLQQLLASHGWERSVSDVGVVRKIANHFKVSLRATTLRLIDLGIAGWDLYTSLPSTVDRKPRGGGGTGRDRGQLRHDQYGDYTIRLFAAALQRDVVSRGDLLDYLDAPPSTLAAGGDVEHVAVESD